MAPGQKGDDLRHRRLQYCSPALERRASVSSPTVDGPFQSLACVAVCGAFAWEGVLGKQKRRNKKNYRYCINL